MRLQIQALTKYGIPENLIFEEKKSGKSVDRAILNLVRKILRSGDTLVVWKLDRLGRDLTGVLGVIEEMSAHGIELVSLTEKFDTTSAMGKAFLQISLVFAELERNMISERTKAGIAAKRARLTEAGREWGRKHMIRNNEARMDHMVTLVKAGVLWFDDEGFLVGLTAEQLRQELNEADKLANGKKAKPIKSVESVRRYLRERDKYGDQVLELMPGGDDE